MKKLSIVMTTVFVIFAFVSVLLMRIHKAEASSSDLVWVDIASQAFSASSTDISGLDFRGIWGSAEDDIFVVGPADTMVGFDGVEWFAQAINTEGRTLNAVYGTDANNVFALADTHRTIFYSSNGETWAKRSSDNLNNALYSLWGLSPDSMIATGNVSIFSVFLTYYYAVMYVNINNSNNIATSTPAAMIHADLYGVWGSSANNVYAVGELGCKRNTLTVRTTDYTTIWHYNGNSDKNWTFVQVPATETLYGIWGSAADDIFAVGASGRILHFDGLVWSAQTSPTSRTLRAVWGSAYDDVYAVGDAGTVLHFNGDAWSVVDTLSTTENLNSIWGSSAANLYIVGSNGTIVRGVLCSQDSDCDDGDPCTSNICNIQQGLCEIGYTTASCDDGLSCTHSDQCSQGICEGIAYSCDDGLSCTDGICDGEGGCDYSLHEGSCLIDGTCYAAGDENPENLCQECMPSEDPMTLTAWSDADGRLCNDGNDCTYGDQCLAGSCSGFAYSCDEVCMEGICNGDGTCDYTPIEGCCIVDEDCEPGYACLGGECQPLDECLDDLDCDEGFACFEGACLEIDAPPVIGDGPFVAAGAWPLVSSSLLAPTVLKQNVVIFWTFNDDFGSCIEDCTHTAEYQVVGDELWTALAVSSDAAQGYAWLDLPVESLQNATTYAFRFAVTDCATQTTQSGIYYFRVATADAPPVITGGPWLTAGSWPLLPTSASRAFVLVQNYDVLWTFSDDYASCTGLCTHRARYRKLGDDIWTWMTAVNTDPTGMEYVYVTLPVESLATGTYQFQFDVCDCAGQYKFPPHYYYFKVVAVN